MFDLFGLEKDHKIRGDEEIELLTTVYDVVMLGIVRGLLEDEKIPYLAHERGSGSMVKIVAGFSQFGTDIYVPKSATERARGLIAGMDMDGNQVSGEPVEFLPETDGALDDTLGDAENEDVVE